MHIIPMFDPKSSRFLRLSVDLDPRHSSKTDELMSIFGTRRAVIEAAIDVLYSCMSLKKRGLRLRGVNPRTSETVDVDPTDLPKVEIAQEVRRISLHVEEKYIRCLVELAKSMRDADLLRVANMMAAEAWNPATNHPSVDAESFCQLIYLARSLNDVELLAVTRDLLTNSITAFKSFDEMLVQALHGYRPGLDTRFLEQRFLDDEFRRELHRKYPAEYNQMRSSGRL